MEGGSEGEVPMSQKESPALHDDPAAKEAGSLYLRKAYSECLNLLHQLHAKKDNNDPKVVHNIGLAEFHRDGCTDPYKLLDVLDQVKRKCEELSRVADEQLEGIGNAASSPNGSTTGVIRPPSQEYIEDYDTSIPCLNTAILYYHLKQYASALSVLEPLFANIEPVDESSALKICLLILDITLSSRRADKAAVVLHYVEKSYGLGQSLENTGNQQPSTPQATLQSTVGGLSFSVGINSSPAPPALVNSPVGENSLTPSAGDETFEEDALSIGLEIDGSRLPTRVPTVEKSPPAAGTDLKLLMHLYRVRFLQLTHGFKAAKREVKSALNLSKDNLSALLLKSQLEYFRGNYRKSMKLLTTCSSRGEAAVMPVILSNLGCVYHYLKKDETAKLFFVKALQKYSAVSKERPLKLSTFSQDKSLQIYYNTGLVHLFSGSPALAALSFQESAPLYYNKPLFWLRLGECCISALEKGLLPDVSPKEQQLNTVVVGQGRYRRLVLPSGSLNPSPTGAAGENEEIPFVDGVKKGKPVKLSMKFGRRCLQNALYLLDRSDVKAEEAAAALAKESEEGGALSEASNVGFTNTGKDLGSFAPAVSAFEQEEKQEKEILRLCVLVDLAFVELCVGDAASALKHSEAALEQDQVFTKAYSFLAHAYAAEALCLLGRMKDAQEHLQTCLGDWTTGAGEAGDEDDKQQMENGEGGSDGEEPSLVDQVIKFQKFTGAQARASLYVNIAAVHAVQGELMEARQFALQALAMAPGNYIALLAVVFVELSQGRAKEALALLKRCRQFTVSRLKPLA